MGLAAAQKFIELGHEVWGTARNPDAAEDLQAAGAAGVVALDLGERSSIDACVAELTTKLDSLDILVNNSGTTEKAFGHETMSVGPLDIDPDLLMDMVRVNTVGPMLLTRGLRPLLGKSDAPLVFSQSSQLASPVIAAKIPYTTGYNISKAGINMFSVMAAVRDPEVTYVSYHPGYVQTDMGGPKADVPVDDAADNLVRNVLAVGPDDTGRFLRPDGSDHPW